MITEEGGDVTLSEGSISSRPGGIFPLSFGGEAIGSLFQGIKPIDKLLAVQPGYLLHRGVRTTVLQARGITVHEGLPLTLGYLGSLQIKICGEGYLMRNFIVISSRFMFGTPHQKSPGRNISK
jgi:hypothetical protein